MIDSNVSEIQRNEILSLVPDAFQSNECWRQVPNTAEGYVYSVSSKRDLLVRHTRIDKLNRKIVCSLLTMQLDVCVYNTAIRRSSKEYSTYIHQVRYDAFPELDPTRQSVSEDVFVEHNYDGLDWYGRRKTSISYLPISDIDMEQIRKFYPEDLPREIWGYVPGSKHKYAISTQGRGVILATVRSNGQYLPPRCWQLKSNSRGKYYECCYSVDGYQLNSVSHPHILRSFVRRPTPDHEVNHIDGDTHNNILDNLEWVTRQENSDHYNHSPEMQYKREIGYRKIAEFGKLHQKEIQNRPEVNAKRAETMRNKYAMMRQLAQTIESQGTLDEN